MKLHARQFTLIEMLGVMIVITILASMMLGAGTYAKRKARHTKAVAQLHAIQLALNSYNDDWGYFPGVSGADIDLDGAFWDSLKAPNNTRYINYREQGFGFKFIDNDPPASPPVNYVPVFTTPDTIIDVLDPFGKPWRFRQPGLRNTASFDLWSSGLNQTDDSPPANRVNASNDDVDDVANWKRN